jgi:hydrogenase small subunit
MKETDLDLLPDHFGMVSRRDFLKFCAVAAAAMGLPLGMGVKIAEAVANLKKPPVIWLSGQECTGCTETLLRSTHPTVENLILDLISLDYHETLSTPSGDLAEEARRNSINENKGKFILVVDGSIPMKDGGIYCQIGGRPVLHILKETAPLAMAVINIGSCASWGGIPSAYPNPTGAVSTQEALGGRFPVINIPGCPPNPYNFLSTVLYILTFKKLPDLDDKNRPLFAYRRLIHEGCERRAHFDAGRFATSYGDKTHAEGYCLYKLGCKGPATHANCSVVRFNDGVAWPVGIGHPCIGCTEPDLLFKTAIADKVQIHEPTPFDSYAPVDLKNKGKGPDPLTTGVIGLAAGAAVGAGMMMAKKLPDGPDKGDDHGTTE